MADHNAATRRAQQATLATADHWGEPWAQHEIDLLDEPAAAAELAELLGRTVYAVQSARHLKAQGVSLGGGVGRKPVRVDVGWAPDDPRWG